MIESNINNQIDDLKLIKKHYGESMMHLCRMLFPTVLETPGLLFSVMSKKFDYSRLLYDDIISTHTESEFKSIIFNEIDVEKEEKPVIKESPKDLLKKVGYDWAYAVGISPIDWVVCIEKKDGVWREYMVKNGQKLYYDTEGLDLYNICLRNLSCLDQKYEEFLVSSFKHELSNGKSK